MATRGPASGQAWARTLMFPPLGLRSGACPLSSGSLPPPAATWSGRLLSLSLQFTGAGQYQGHLPGLNPGSGINGSDVNSFDPKGISSSQSDKQFANSEQLLDFVDDLFYILDACAKRVSVFGFRFRFCQNLIINGALSSARTSLSVKLQHTKYNSIIFHCQDSQRSSHTKKPNILDQAKGKLGQAVDYLSGQKRKERPPVEEVVFPYEVTTRSDLLGQRQIPYFGVYGYEYTWLEPIGVFKKDFTQTADLNLFRKAMPRAIDELIQNGVEQKIISRCSQIEINFQHFYILNLNARNMKNFYLYDQSQTHIRLNFAPHALLLPDARHGQDIKFNILSALYTSSDRNYVHSSQRGIQECKDFGKIQLNPSYFFDKRNTQEVHLHPADPENTAISPNNGAFLLNLTMPIVNFHLVMSTLEQHNQQIFIFNVTIVNDESMRLTRQIDTCLNTAKVFTHTPKAQEMVKSTDEQSKKMLMPAMYSINIFCLLYKIELKRNLALLCTNVHPWDRRIQDYSANSRPWIDLDKSLSNYSTSEICKDQKNTLIELNCCQKFIPQSRLLRLSSSHLFIQLGAYH